MGDTELQADSAAILPSKKRKRTTYSCQVCRKKKIKCDTARPCNNCVLLGGQCVYDPAVAQAQSHATAEDIRYFSQVGDIESLRPRSNFLIDILAESKPIKLKQIQVSAKDDTFGAVSPVLRQLEGGPPKRQSDTSLSKLDIFAWASVEPFLTTSELTRTRHGNFLNSYECRTSDVLYDNLPEVLDGRVIESLIGVYYRQVHIKHPLFDLDIARRCRAQQYQIGHDLLGATVSTMMALGALVAEGEYSYLREYQDQTITMADRRLQSFLLGMTLDNVRVIYLYGMLQLFLFRPWPYIQMVSLAASKLALIHDLEAMSKGKHQMSPSEQRLYWSCCKGEEEIQFLWRNYLPILSLDQTLEESFPTPPAVLYDPYGCNDESWFYYLSEIAAHKISRRVVVFVTDRFDCKGVAHADEILRHREDLLIQVQNWYESLPEFLRFPIDTTCEIQDHIDTKPHMRTYYFLVFAQYSMFIIYHGLHGHLDDSYDDCLRLAIKDLRSALIIHSRQERHRLHFGTYFMIRSAIELAIVTVLCAHSTRFIGLMHPGAEDEAVHAMEHLKIFMHGTRALKKGFEIFSRIQVELSTSP